MGHGICVDWVDVNDKETNPDWMRQKQPKPCECGMCFSANRASQTASTIIIEQHVCVKMHQVEHQGIRSRKIVQ